MADEPLETKQSGFSTEAKRAALYKELPPYLQAELDRYRNSTQLAIDLPQGSETSDLPEIGLPQEQKKGLRSTFHLVVLHFIFPLISEANAWRKSGDPEGIKLHKKNTLWLGALTLGVSTWLCFDAKYPLFFDSKTINFFQDKLDLGSLTDHAELGTVLLYFALITIASYIVRGLTTYHTLKNSDEDQLKDNAARLAARYTFLGKKPTVGDPEIVDPEQAKILTSEVKKLLGTEIDNESQDNDRASTITSEFATQYGYREETTIYQATIGQHQVNMSTDNGSNDGRPAPVPPAEIYNNLYQYYYTQARNDINMSVTDQTQRAREAAMCAMTCFGFTYDEEDGWRAPIRQTVPESKTSEPPHTPETESPSQNSRDDDTPSP